MTEVDRLIDLKSPRIELLRGGRVPEDAQCVLWWVSRAKRILDNPAADTAIRLANARTVPVVAVFCLVDDYPRATERAYAFMLEGLVELGRDITARGIGWLLRRGSPAAVIPALAVELGAGVVVTDLDPLRTGRQWRTDVAERLRVPMAVVDADTVVPSSFFPREEWAPRTIRPRIQRLMPDLLSPLTEPDVIARSDVREELEVGSMLRSLPLDRTVSRSPEFRGGAAEARRRLDLFVRDRLPTYDVDRNRADVRGTSELSPYLHFGQIGPVTIVRAVRNSGADGESIDSFINELVVQRELCINFTLRNPHYDSFAGIPDWGQKTLRKHAGDEREHIYDRETLETGDTNDPLWNAAQRQMVAEGWMPNRLRMYWAKRLLHWTASPEEALETAVAFNDRYFIDGRDANGYAGIAWSIGGRHDRPFPPERPVTGLIRPMGAKGLRRHFDTDAYIAEVNRRYGR